MRILLTNDDGIDSLGLIRLAAAIAPLGEVVVVAPDSEYSGSSASLGALHSMRPEAHHADLPGIDEAWTVTGPPGLCVLLARIGAFGDPPGLVVSGINPGMNVGRAVYHSGTVGAALTARNGGVTGIAVSQNVTDWGVIGQAEEEQLDKQLWDSAAAVAASITAEWLENPTPPVVLNVNVPNLPLDEIKGHRIAPLGFAPPRSIATAHLEAKAGHQGAYTIHAEWSDVNVLPPGTDGAVAADGYVAMSWLSSLEHTDSLAHSHPFGTRLDRLFGNPEQP